MILRNHEELSTHAAVLNNPDILEEIFENLHVDYVWELEPDEVVARRKVLAAAALTCKAFLQPALDRLWRSLDKLFPLFKLLPAFYRSDTTFVLRGHITDAHWDRFDWYARRVKYFSYKRDPDSLDIAMHVYFRIAQLRRLPLLPCLRHLKCPNTSRDDFLISSICLFLTPSLKSVSFDKITGIEDKLIGTFLHTLLCDGARLESVDLTGEGLTKDTLGYLGKCKHLKSLTVKGMGMNIDLDIIREVGTIPGLVELVLDLGGSGLLSATESDVIANGNAVATGDGDLGYKELVHLDLIAPLSFVKSFVMKIGATQLQTIKFESSTEAVVDRKDLLAVMVRRWKDTLTDLRMVHADPTDENPLPDISMDTISPLLSLSRLTHLEMEGFAMHLTDENIADIASSWTCIQFLHLPFTGIGSQKPTVVSLQILAEKCRQLKHLTIPLTIPLATTSVSGLLEDRLSLHPLETLSIVISDEPWDLRIALMLARLIDHLFPFLDKVEAQDGRGEGRWQQVHEMVKMYQLVRSEAVALCKMSSGECMPLALKDF